MTEILTTLAPQGLATNLTIGLVVGLLLGLAHFGTLWWNVRLFAGGGGLGALGLQLFRFALLGAVLFLLAKLGAVALLAGALGLLLARSLLLRHLGPKA